MNTRINHLLSMSYFLSLFTALVLSSGIVRAQNVELTAEELFALLPTDTERQSAVGASPFHLRDGMVVFDRESLPRGEEKDFERLYEIAIMALRELQGSDLSKTKKVAVIERDSVNLVIFDYVMTELSFGPSFAYILVLDKNTGERIRTIVG